VPKVKVSLRDLLLEDDLLSRYSAGFRKLKLQTSNDLSVIRHLLNFFDFLRDIQHSAECIVSSVFLLMADR